MEEIYGTIQSISGSEIAEVLKNNGVKIDFFRIPKFDFSKKKKKVIEKALKIDASKSLNILKNWSIDII